MSRWLPSAAITEHLIVLLLSGGWLALSLEHPYGSITSPGPGFLPTILGVLGAALGLGGLLSVLRDRAVSSNRSGGEQEVPSLAGGGTSAVREVSTGDVPSYTPDTPGRSRVWALSVTIASTIAFIVVLPVVGYGLAMAGLMFAYLMVGAVRLRHALVVAVLGSVGSWLLFEWLLGLPLPGDLLDRVFGL